MTAFFDFFLILSIVAWLVGSAAHGFISAQMAALCLVGLTILMAIGRAGGIGLGSTILRVSVPVLSILALALYYGDGTMRGAVAIFSQIAVLGIVLYGIYTIVSGPFRR